MDSSLVLFALGGVLVAGLVVWTLLARRSQRRAQKQALERLGFRPCPDETARLQEVVERIEHNRGFRYEVREPRRLGDEPLYYYGKVCHGGPRDEASAEEELLFPLKRRTAAGLVLIVKPSSLSEGLAARIIGAVATGPWDAQPDDLRRLELPPDVRGTNILGALAPPGASLYDLVEPGVLSVVQGLGDAGGMFVHFRDEWCSVAGGSAQITFRLEELVSRLRPLLS